MEKLGKVKRKNTFRSWFIATIVALFSILLLDIISVIFNIELAFVKGWISCAIYFIVLKYEHNIENEIDLDKMKDLQLRNIELEENNKYLHAKLYTNEETKLIPCNLIMVIDVSGSMGEDASIATESGEKDGFSRLDIVRHCILTILESLDENDSISIITFSTNANVVFELTKMDLIGKIEAIKCINSLVPDATTNLYNGLIHGIGEIQKVLNSSIANNDILVFTDGESNCDPPRGVFPSFNLFLNSLNLKIPFTITTCGFGYSLNSQLL